MSRKRITGGAKRPRIKQRAQLSEAHGSRRQAWGWQPGESSEDWIMRKRLKAETDEQLRRDLRHLRTGYRSAKRLARAEEIEAEIARRAELRKGRR